MKQKYYWILGIFAAIVVVGIILVTNTQKGSSPESKPVSPLTIDLSLSPFTAGETGIGRKAEITATVQLIEDVEDVENVNAEIILPVGLRHISGNLTWQGNIILDTPTIFRIMIETAEIGIWTVKGSVINSGVPYTFGDNDYVYVLISESEILTSKTPFAVTPTNGEAQPIDVEPEPSNGSGDGATPEPGVLP